MLEKKQLHELFVITGKLDDVSSVDINMLKNHVLSNWSLNNRVSDNDFKYEHDYSKVPYHQHIQWLGLCARPLSFRIWSNTSSCTQK